MNKCIGENSGNCWVTVASMLMGAVDGRQWQVCLFEPGRVALKSMLMVGGKQ